MSSLAEEILGDELISIKNESFNQGEIKGRKEGKRKGKIEGEIEGERKGRIEGERKGRIEERRNILGKIKDMINNKCSIEDIKHFVDNFKD